MSPKSNRNSVILCMLLLISGSVTLFLLQTKFGSTPEPEYGGYPISYWLKELEKSPSQEVRTALKVIGPEAAPYLVELLHSEDTLFKRYLRENWQMIPSVVRSALDYPTSSVKLKFIAVEGLEILGTKSIKVLPELIDALSDPNDSVKIGSASVLRAIGPSAAEAVPALLRAIGPSAAEAVPALLTALNHSTQMVRNGIEQALIQIWKYKKTETKTAQILSQLEMATDVGKFSLCRIYCRINPRPPKEITTIVSNLVNNPHKRELQEETALLIADDTVEFSENLKRQALWLLLESRNDRVRRMATSRIQTFIKLADAESQKSFAKRLKHSLEDSEIATKEKLNVLFKIRSGVSHYMNQFPLVMNWLNREPENINYSITDKLKTINWVRFWDRDYAAQFPFVSSLLVKWLEEEPNWNHGILLELLLWGVSDQYSRDLTSVAKHLSDPHQHTRLVAARVIGKTGPSAMSFLPELEKLMTNGDPLENSIAAEVILQIAPNHVEAFQVFRKQFQVGDASQKSITAWNMAKYQLPLPETLRTELASFFLSLADDNPAKPHCLAAIMVLLPENKEAHATLLRLMDFGLGWKTLSLLEQHPNLPPETIKVLKQLLLKEEFTAHRESLNRFR
ncbi:MAG TPA: HEAT repeat domain-containing protein [Verrucomicrobiales bacterium]|nr:HEAT repeat domain-containing protein [Verrucomicrobiales bacterium]